MIYTFYSFKGGVGRSMALANIAEILYGRGLKVLMIDFDLEAPGLERYFTAPKTVTKPREVLSKRGVIDMLMSYSELNSLRQFDPPQKSEHEGFAEGFSFNNPVEPLTDFIVPIYDRNPLGGELSIIPAGRREGSEFTSYAQHIRAFDWEDFYANRDGEAFFEWFRQEAETTAEVVLIDSRTGVSEMSGACTYLLADTVVMFVGPNQQNLDGTAMLAESLSSKELVEQRGRPLSLLFVPSRVEYGEMTLLDEFAKSFKERFERPGDTGRRIEGGGFDDLKLIYLPYFSYMEKVAVREPERAGASDIVKAYERIVGTLAQLEPEDGPLRTTFLPETAEKRAKVFISYCRVEPDASVARAIHEGLSNDHDVFSDQSILIGADWAREIETRLNQTEFLIVLISQYSSQSEMILAEVERAYRLARSRGGRPMILPVRINDDEPLPYRLGAYLARIQWAVWGGDEDTPELIRQLLTAISGGEVIRRSQLSEESFFFDPLARSVEEPIRSKVELLERPEEPVNPQSPFYIAREVDSAALASIGQRGVTITIKGPDQVGKTSLLYQTIEAAERAQKRVILIDFQLLDKDTLDNADRFFVAFCRWITAELEVEDRVDDYWDMPLGNGTKCSRYFSRYLLKTVSGPLVLAMDEVSALFETDFRTDFFSMLRYWHNQRSLGSIWKDLDLVLVTSTEPYQLIRNLNQSPFNVGDVLELGDFNMEQVSELNKRHGSPLHPSEVRQLMDLIGGHPYLIRHSLYLVATNAITVDQLFAQANDAYGPFGDHLRRHLLRLHQNKSLTASLREVIDKQSCSDEEDYFRLYGAGLVRRLEGRKVTTRCRLYSDYFKERL